MKSEDGIILSFNKKKILGLTVDFLYCLTTIFRLLMLLFKIKQFWKEVKIITVCITKTE